MNMKILDVIVLAMLFVTLAFGTYVLFEQYPRESIEYKPFVANNLSQVIVSGKIQFYPNLRYSDKTISYEIDRNCGVAKRNEAIEAFSVLSQKTILSFHEISDAGEIKVLCSEFAPEPEQKDHFVAGEGGPTEIINTSVYYVILSGKISLFRSDKCDNPNIAIHEILHALGFDHNSNSKSIMYPITTCDQQIDNYIIEEVKRLYSIKSALDLGIEKVSGSKAGRYLSFNIVIANYGFKDADNVNLEVLSNGEVIKEFELDRIPIGTRKFLDVQNVRISGDADKIVFVVKTYPEIDEISQENNLAEISIV